MFSSNGADGLHAHCKVCQRELSREHYQDNKERYSDRIGTKQEALRLWVAELKSKPCMDCGFQFKPWQMDFDHRDHLMKSMEISKMIVRCMPKERIVAEVAKCDLVCANCHRDRTYQQRLAYLACQRQNRQQIKNLRPAQIKIPRPVQPKPICQDCGIEVWPGSKRCRGCQEALRIVWPSVEKLVHQLAGTTFEALGRELKVSSGAIRKHLIACGFSREALKRRARVHLESELARVASAGC